MYRDKTVLIIGGTGSFGKAMVNELIAQGAGEIRIFSRDEAKQDAMRNDPSLHPHNIKYHIGDVRDLASVQKAMHGVDLAFHAAALKQVPSCEFFPMQAVKTNIIGSHNVIEAALAANICGLVSLSTDKAAMPINAMGMTKALMEKLVQAAARDLGPENTTLSCVRYGNVMYSRGSVIPVFIRQINAGLPLTVTEPSMTRFMLPLKQATELVSYAFANAKQGDLFVRKAPACTVGDLARAMLELFNIDLPIKVIGIRHGEKLYETLVTREELTRTEDLDDYYRVRLDDRDLNYDKYFFEGERDEINLTDYTSHNTDQLDIERIKSLLLTLPEIKRELPS